jgi:hypothetical protein
MKLPTWLEDWLRDLIGDHRKDNIKIQKISAEMYEIEGNRDMLFDLVCHAVECPDGFRQDVAMISKCLTQRQQEILLHLLKNTES